jgi:septum formation protein
MTGQSTPIVLASTSAYRAALMQKLGIRFDQVDPVYKEQTIEGEAPEAMAMRLAAGKALAAAHLSVTDAASTAIFIGSDQVAHIGLQDRDHQTTSDKTSGKQTSTDQTPKDQKLSKPGNFANAFKQLQLCSGQWVTYSTAVCLVRRDGQVLSHFCERYRLRFRTLSDDLISRYLKLDQPYDCAGSIKAEAHGIMLIEDSEGQDINTLYGLPLIRLTTELTVAGVTIPLL